MTEERVVVTGMGTINPLGENVNETWLNLLSGKITCNKITRFNTDNCATKIACEIKNYDPHQYLDRKEANKLDLVSQFALIAANEAILQSKLSEIQDKTRIGVIWATGNGGASTYDNTLKGLFKEQPQRVSPYFIPKVLLDTSSGMISIKHGLKGVNYTTVSACASGSTAIADAFNYIKWGKADAIVTGGSDAPICESLITGFNALKALSKENENPQKAIKPFDVNRSGFVMGEGGACLVLESLTSAKKRGANILAEVAGGGINADAYHMTAGHPEGEGAARCMSLALDEAGIKMDDIDYINAHATSTKVGDLAESKAIKSLLNNDKTIVGGTKSMTGHLMGAAGAIEGLFCTLAVKNDMIPPNVNLERIDPEIMGKFTLAKDQKESKVINYALSNNFGFGGHNSTVIMKKFKE